MPQLQNLHTLWNHQTCQPQKEPVDTSNFKDTKMKNIWRKTKQDCETIQGTESHTSSHIKEDHHADIPGWYICKILDKSDSLKGFWSCSCGIART